MKWYISSWNGVLDDLKDKVADKISTPRDSDVWVVWQDCRGSYSDLIKTARFVGINKPVYCVQHGGGSTRDYDKPNSRDLLADKYLCWGTNDYNRLVALGYKEKAEIVGCPLNTHIKPKNPHKEKVVLFIPVNTGKEEPENIAVYYDLLKIKYDKAKDVVLANAKGLKDKWGIDGKLNVSFNELAVNFEVASKLLPWHDRPLYHGNTVIGYPDTYKNNHVLFELLRNVDLVVGLDEGTSELFAFAHDVPVITVDMFKFRQYKDNGKDFETHDIGRSIASQHCNIEDLAYWVDYCLAHPEYKRAERKEVAEAELGISYGNATENIYKLIRKDMKEGVLRA